MRIANVDGRLTLLTRQGPVDVEEVSGGRFTSDPQAVYDVWDEFAGWAREQGDVTGVESGLDTARLGAPVPQPRQIFAIGLNYVDHVEESGNDLPSFPTVFTNFQSAITGPTGTVRLSGDSVDWEVELVVVVGRGGRDIPAAQAWQHVAGVTAGQDLSDREVQLRPPAPQFSVGKSFAGYAPIGPVVVTPDELADPDDIALGCALNGEQVQSSTTAQLVFSVPQVIEYLSAVVELYPGDLIFTGTPAGVGLGRTPPEYLRPGDVVETWVAGVGAMRHEFVGA
ncbi:fumarylacetoacetate hydrolase family protein [Cellulomonas sp. Sa3CUA2]|uniref:Fumarylacetoacetate hydrolase family protein n=1 Tax=Cellulomonas avistercoris TaxID=2762242 RepID=A0ABR8QGQ8_9CELL|nr:fumarylacetoacetate hydrolase family protein [Cellulomonas avistercoris]MBD7919604.1 fumarylacetoacetate hydrolase family protein [Cellulomonas avistercoris]